MTEFLLRQIKKYSNRRLYDTQSSSYINLEDLVNLVSKGESLVIKDAKTDEEISSAVLLQALMELPDAVSLFPSSLIQRAIRYTQNSDANPALAKQMAANMALLDAQFEALEGEFPWPGRLPLSRVKPPPQEPESDPEMEELQLEMAALESRLRDL